MVRHSMDLSFTCLPDVSLPDHNFYAPTISPFFIVEFDYSCQIEEYRGF